MAMLPKGVQEKLVMARWLRGHTKLSRPWIAQRLQKGHETQVTLAARAVSRTKGSPQAELKQRIEAVPQPEDA